MSGAYCIMRPENCEYNISNDGNLFDKNKNVNKFVLKRNKLYSQL